MALRTELATGSRLATYTIEAVLGRGGMSVVYAAHDDRLDRRVALKVLAPSIGDDARFRARFLAESRLAASLDHPNVIPVYEAGEAADLLFIAMRLVEGLDLGALLRAEGPLDPPRALRIVSQAARALDAAHARGLLHRDVKPANILLAEGDHVYLSDFGLAVPGGGEWALEGASFLGTAEYAAPEQIEGRPEPRSDVYALACVLFECLTGEPPYGRGRLLETLWSHLDAEPPRPTERRPELPAALDDVLSAALAKDPDERPRTCGELASAASAALGLGPRARRRRRLAVLAATLGVAATASAALLAVGTDALRDSPAATRSGTIETFAGSGERGLDGDGGPAVRAALADPGSIAVTPAGDVVVATTGALRRIDRAGVISTVTESSRGQLGVHPDGTVYLLEAGTLSRVGADGTLEHVAGDGRAAYLEDAAFTASTSLCVLPVGPAFDHAGRIHLACPTANRVVRVEPGRGLTTVVGTGAAGFSGDGGPAARAELNRPVGIAFDREGNLFVADFLNNRVRKVDAGGTITTAAGTGRIGFSGDGWRAPGVDLWRLLAVETDAEGNLYVVEAGPISRVRKIDRAGVISTIAGTGRRGYSGDGGPATAAELAQPTDVAVGRDGVVYISDTVNHRIRRVFP